ncbi:MAG: MFS transporter [Thermoflexales bacterium]
MACISPLALAPLLVAASLTVSGQVRIAWLAIGAVNVLIMLAALTVSPPRPSVSQTASAGTRPPTPKLVLLGLLFFAYAGCEATMFTWTADYGVSLGFERTGAATTLATAFWLSFMAGRLLVIPATHRWSIRNVSIGAHGLGIVSGLVFVLSAGKSFWIWPAVCGLGIAIGPILPNMLAFVGERLGATAGVAGYVFVLGSLGSMLWPWLAGQLFESTRGAVIPWMALGFVASSMLIFTVFDRATLPSRAPQ